ncbi:MAG TPA: RNA polymerase sigma factor [Nannocystaceae bacterium]|nr:RNA polymerase sigma factor [Nannocystaceae bacterium]
MDDASFDRIYREHVAFVWRLSRSLGVAELAVDDVVHEVFLVIERRFDQRADAVPVRAWIARIVRNVVMHHHRGRAREAHRIAQLVPPEAPRGPDDELGLVEAAARVQRFLDGLDVARREVFALIEIEGLTAPQVAELTGTKLPTVYTRLRSARAELAAFVELDRAAAGGTHARR